MVETVFAEYSGFIAIFLLIGGVGYYWVARLSVLHSKAKEILAPEVGDVVVSADRQPKISMSFKPPVQATDLNSVASVPANLEEDKSGSSAPAQDKGSVETESPDSDEGRLLIDTAERLTQFGDFEGAREYCYLAAELQLSIRQKAQIESLLRRLSSV